jgi:putative transposase
MVAHPRDYPWSSYRAHADGARDALVSGHPLYRRLGKSTAARQQEYRNLFRGKLPEAFLEALRAATNGGWALGDERFKKQIAKMAGRRVAPLPKGRPAADPKDKRQLSLL